MEMAGGLFLAVFIAAAQPHLASAPAAVIQ